MLFGLAVSPVAAANWYVATDGLDSNSGASNSPFATIMKAQSAASSGDTVWLRGGTYYLDNSHLTYTNSAWATVNYITKSGISYLAYPGELPVFDFSAVQPSGWRVTAFLVTAGSCVFKGFDVVGVQITIAGTHTQSECFRVASTGAKFNRFENLRMHDGMGIGWYLTDGTSNLVLNCDAYNNRGLDSGSLGNIDGFGCHPAHTSGTGNVLRGCRAWFNSDDGFDLINADAPVLIENCWSFWNGYFTNFSNSTGDGNGFKSGGYGVSGGSYPIPVPRHVTRFCLAVKNRANGFYANHHTGGLDWFDNTAYRNGGNFNMLCNLDAQSSTNDVPGFDHVLKNNLGYKGGSEVSNLGPVNDTNFNYFTLPVIVATNDFIALDESLLTAPRLASGALPYVNFARLTNTSDCINAGTNQGFAFYGAAPDLGAFESGPTNAPNPSIAKSGGDFVFNTSGWANQTNYLWATTNLASTNWICLATNKSDLAGNCAFTNSSSGSLTQRFFRVSIP